MLNFFSVYSTIYIRIPMLKTHRFTLRFYNIKEITDHYCVIFKVEFRNTSLWNCNSGYVNLDMQ